MAKRKRWVYLVGSPDVRPVKIGTAFDPEARLRDFQVGSLVPLRLLWKTEGRTDLEKSLHEYFGPYRIHGEWFDFGDEEPIALVVAAAARMGFWTRPQKSGGEPRFVSRSEWRDRWYAEHGDEPCESVPPLLSPLPVDELPAAPGMPDAPTWDPRLPPLPPLPRNPA